VYDAPHKLDRTSSKASPFRLPVADVSVFCT
jgi:hypothetical protein